MYVCLVMSASFYMQTVASMKIPLCDKDQVFLISAQIILWLVDIFAAFCNIKSLFFMICCTGNLLKIRNYFLCRRLLFCWLENQNINMHVWFTNGIWFKNLYFKKTLHNNIITVFYCLEVSSKLFGHMHYLRFKLMACFWTRLGILIRKG